MFYDHGMARISNDYQVARSTGLCAASGQTLEPGEPCVASLCEREEDDGFDRLDFSVEAWDGGHRPPRLFSFWRTTVAHKEERKRIFVDDQVLSDLFDRLADDDRPQRIAFRFILALILMRKRLLKFVGRETTPDASSEVWLMRPKGTDPDSEPIRVHNPRLSDDDVRDLTAQLGEVLQTDFD